MESQPMLMNDEHQQVLLTYLLTGPNPQIIRSQDLSIDLTKAIAALTRSTAVQQPLGYNDQMEWYSRKPGFVCIPHAANSTPHCSQSTDLFS
jgi:hypothetical protein